MQILLVTDVQQRYLKNYKPDLVNRVNARIREAMSKEIPVVYVRNTGRSDKFYYKELKTMELKGAKVLMNLEEL